MKKTYIILALTITSLLTFLSGCQLTNPSVQAMAGNGGEGELTAGQPGETTSLLADLYAGIQLAPTEIYEKFAKNLPNVQVYKIELERKRNRYEYEVKGFDGERKYEIKFDAKNGAILKDKAKRKTEEKLLLSLERVAHAESLVLQALEDVGQGAVLEEWTLEAEGQQFLLEVEMKFADGRKVEYIYDIDTGALLRPGS